MIHSPTQMDSVDFGAVFCFAVLLFIALLAIKRYILDPKTYIMPLLISFVVSTVSFLGILDLVSAANMKFM